MKMQLEIIKNDNEIVNEIETENEAKIYKEVAKIFHYKYNGNAIETTINILAYEIKNATQVFGGYKDKYTYKYYFTDVML